MKAALKRELEASSDTLASVRFVEVKPFEVDGDWVVLQK